MPSSSARFTQLPRAVDKLPFYMALKKLRDYLCGLIPAPDQSEVSFPEANFRIIPKHQRPGYEGEQPAAPASSGDKAKSSSHRRRSRKSKSEEEALNEDIVAGPGISVSVTPPQQRGDRFDDVIGNPIVGRAFESGGGGTNVESAGKAVTLSLTPSLTPPPHDLVLDVSEEDFRSLEESLLVKGSSGGVRAVSVAAPAPGTPNELQYNATAMTSYPLGQECSTTNGQPQHRHQSSHNGSSAVVHQNIELPNIMVAFSPPGRRNSSPRPASSHSNLDNSSSAGLSHMSAQNLSIQSSGYGSLPTSPENEQPGGTGIRQPGLGESDNSGHVLSGFSNQQDINLSDEAFDELFNFTGVKFNDTSESSFTNELDHLVVGLSGDYGKPISIAQQQKMLGNNTSPVLILPHADSADKLLGSPGTQHPNLTNNSRTPPAYQCFPASRSATEFLQQRQQIRGPATNQYHALGHQLHQQNGHNQYSVPYFNASSIASSNGAAAVGLRQQHGGTSPYFASQQHMVHPVMPHRYPHASVGGSGYYNATTRNHPMFGQSAAQAYPGAPHSQQWPQQQQTTNHAAFHGNAATPAAMQRGVGDSQQPMRHPYWDSF